MRVALIFLLALTGCDDQNAVVNPNDLSAEADLADSDSGGNVEPDLYGVVVDLTPAGDGSNPINPSDLAGVDAQNPANDLGGVGTSCTTACDCMPGLACFQTMCTSGIASVYCCEGLTCPANAFCQHTDSTFGRCGGGADMAFDVCPIINCKGGMGLQKCMNAGCSMCVASGNNMVCAK